jgi:hypothetical protein
MEVVYQPDALASPGILLEMMNFRPYPENTVSEPTFWQELNTFMFNEH